MESRFRVCVRVRPIIKEDMSQIRSKSIETQICTKCHEDNQRIFLLKPYHDDREFIYDAVL
jgi:hypothetical protein